MTRLEAIRAIAFELYPEEFEKFDRDEYSMYGCRYIPQTQREHEFFAMLSELGCGYYDEGWFEHIPHGSTDLWTVQCEARNAKTKKVINAIRKKHKHLFDALQGESDDHF